MPPQIIYEDADVLVLNKPAGILVESSAAASLKDFFPDTAGPAHRLDRETSGILLWAKTVAAKNFLQSQFKDRQVKKTYYALVYGVPHERRGTIDAPIGRSRRHPALRRSGGGLSGRIRSAITDYRLLESLGRFALLELSPRTGRTHQLRVHLRHLGYPVVCDKLYAPGRVCPPPLVRQALHAKSLECLLPGGSRGRFEADLPPDFAQALVRLRRLC